MSNRESEAIISTFLDSLGPWHRSVVIGGGYAPIIYKIYLADQPSAPFPVGTHDIDSLIPRRMPEIASKDIGTHLREANFVQQFRDFDQPATEAYVKTINGTEIEIEFLTDNGTRQHKGRNVEISGVVAQPLRSL